MVKPEGVNLRLDIENQSDLFTRQLQHFEEKQKKTKHDEVNTTYCHTDLKAIRYTLKHTQGSSIFL